MNKEEIIKIDGIPIQDYNGFTSKTIYNDEIYKSETPIVKPAIYNEYIPKQKLRDKIEELKKTKKLELKGMKGQDRYFVKQIYQYKIQVLEELLEEENK